jgi:hypothetical protein
MDLSETLPLRRGRSEYWVKIKDEFTGYSWDYFIYEKSTASAALEDKLTW